MIPRSQNPLSTENLKHPASPKFGSSYGLQANSIQRQVLLDQIINNCQRAESPINANNRNSYQSSKNNSLRTDEKENARNWGSPGGMEKLSIGKRNSYQCQKIATHRPVTEHERQKRSSLVSNPNPPIPHLLSPKSNRAPEQYFQKPLKLPTSPTYKLRTNLEIPKPKRPSSGGRDPVQRESLASCGGNCEEMERVRVRKRFQDERIKHIEHCRREERKLRLYYVELENKLCEMRNKELRLLAEYETSQLRQYDSSIKSMNSPSQPIDLPKMQTKLDQISKQATAKVNESIKPEIQGCLFTGVSGIYFSFDQNCFAGNL